jgi:uncharacterized Zn-binding protein involved in type VI secretion
MGTPAATADDQVTAVDIHIVMVPAGPAQVPTPLPHSFSGKLGGALASSVKIGGKAAAVVGSTADNSPTHQPTPPGTTFQNPPSNKATIKMGSASVKIEGKAAARQGDIAESCNDPADLPIATVMGSGPVNVGG